LFFMIDDWSQLERMKTSGLPNKIIAARMGITEDEVERWWKVGQAMIKSAEGTGVNEAWEVVVGAANQVKLLSQTLWMISNLVGNMAKPDQIQKVLDSKPDDVEMAVWLASHFIILNPFVPPSPEEMIKQMEAASRPSSGGD